GKWKYCNCLEIENRNGAPGKKDDARNVQRYGKLLKPLFRVGCNWIEADDSQLAITAGDMGQVKWPLCVSRDAGRPNRINATRRKESKRREKETLLLSKEEKRLEKRSCIDEDEVFIQSIKSPITAEHKNKCHVFCKVKQRRRTRRNRSGSRRSRQRHLTETEAHGVGWSPRGGTACWEDKVQYGETCKRSCGRQEEIQEQDQTCWPDVVKRPDEDLTPSRAQLPSRKNLSSGKKIHYLHHCSIYLNVVLMDRIKEQGGRPLGDAEYAQDALTTEGTEYIVPEAVQEYVRNIGKFVTPTGEDVYLNVPDIAIPRVSDDQHEAGLFGPCDDAIHNAYECYISPAVTARCVIAMRDNDAQWQPLPPDLAPEDGIPTRNLLGFDDLQDLTAEGRSRLQGIFFPNGNTVEARHRYSYELAARVNTYFRSISDKFKASIITRRTLTRTGLVNTVFAETQNEYREGPDSPPLSLASINLFSCKNELRLTDTKFINEAGLLCLNRPRWRRLRLLETSGLTSPATIASDRDILPRNVRRSHQRRNSNWKRKRRRSIIESASAWSTPGQRGDFLLVQHGEGELPI
ncbi:unnamed protein product, partial [Nesidiocoris tenuis]